MQLKIVPQTNYRQTTEKVVEVAPKLIIDRCKGEKKKRTVNDTVNMANDKSKNRKKTKMKKKRVG